MRLVTYATPAGRSFGILTEGGVIDLALRLGVSSIEAMLEADLLPVAASYARAAVDVANPRLLKPLHAPGKCFCVGVNYPDRDAEYTDGRPPSMNMSLFQRVPESLAGPDEPILRPRESLQFDYEGEIAIVIGKPGRRIARAAAMSHVAAYTLANEGSVRDWMRHGKFNVTQGKNFFQSGSLGPWLVTTDEAGPGPFSLTTRVNGEIRQQDSTARMIFPMDEIVAYISTFTPLAPGDLILTGTPTGAGARFDPPRWLVPGDVVEVEVPGIGRLRNTVCDEATT